MIQRKTLVTALSGVLVGGLLLTGGMAVAGDTGSSVSDSLAGKMPFFGKMMKHRGGMGPGGGQMMAGRGLMDGRGVFSQATLDQLVKNGVITQAKADEIKAYVEKQKADSSGIMRGRRGAGLLDELVTNKILTRQQADTIQTKTREIAQQMKQQQLSDTLKAVVKKGIITQEQSDKILQRYADTEKEHAALDQKMQDMTLKEIRQYMQDNKGTARNPLQGLVADGVITQKQVDAIGDFMRETAQKQQLQRMSDSLKTLVDKGTITQAQSDKILKKIEAVQKEREALMDKVKDMTAEERRQYMQDNREKLQSRNPLSQLVADGTITQKQADAIKEIVPVQKGFKGGMN